MTKYPGCPIWLWPHLAIYQSQLRASSHFVCVNPDGDVTEIPAAVSSARKAAANIQADLMTVHLKTGFSCRLSFNLSKIP